jgi:hypothetical protein
MDHSIVMKRDGVGFDATGGSLRITSLAYDAGPVHLSREDLAFLGFALLPCESRGSSSAVKRWREAARQARGELPRRPAPWGGPGLTAGDVRLVPVEEGLDVFVLDYHAPPATLHAAQLARLGLRLRGAD